MSKPVILTGLRANNDLHIGNYFGALLPLIDMAKKHAGEYQINLFVPDLHSFTTPIDHSQLQEQIMNNLKLFAAAGLPLDNPDVHIYRQSYIPAHSELTVIMNNFTGMGQMRRMTQFADKSGTKDTFAAIKTEIVRTASEHLTQDYMAKFNEVLTKFYSNFDSATVGLFDYPVLMACDILLYGAQYVPVGDDQSQHIEITRDLGNRLNTKFGELFILPHEVKKQHEFFGKDQGLRIKDLVDPTKKMSKSDESGKGIIFLGDDPILAAKKIMSSTTDSVGEIHYDPKEQPGISNLLQILALLQDSQLKSVIEKYEGNTSYGELKKDVAKAVETFLTQFQQRLSAVNVETLNNKLVSSEAKMNEIANQTLLKVQKAVGLR